MAENFQTALKRVSGFGSSHHGVAHFIAQRVSAIALIILVPWCVISAIIALQGDYTVIREWVASPINAFALILLLAAGFYHMRLGIQIVIEDYIARPASRALLLLLNYFLTIGFATASILAVLMIVLGR